MKRVKTKKKKKTYTLTERDIESIKFQIYKKAVSTVLLTVLAAAHDELKLSDKKLCALAKTADRYASYVEDNKLRIKEVKRIIEKNTDLKFEWR